MTGENIAVRGNIRQDFDRIQCISGEKTLGLTWRKNFNHGLKTGFFELLFYYYICSKLDNRITLLNFEDSSPEVGVS